MLFEMAIFKLVRLQFCACVMMMMMMVGGLVLIWAFGEKVLQKNDANGKALGNKEYPRVVFQIVVLAGTYAVLHF